MIQVRINSILTFADSEKDIVDTLRKMTDNHGLSRFLTNLIKIVFDNREALGLSKDGAAELEKLLSQWNITAVRNEYLGGLKTEIQEMRKRVDMLFDKAASLEAVALAGKRFGLEERANNIYRATFMIDRQLRDIEKTLGMYNLVDVSADVNIERAEKALEMIINSYSGVLTEIQAASKEIRFESRDAEPDEQLEETVNITKDLDGTKKEAKEPEVLSDDALVDFGNDFDENADMEALANFFS